MPPSPFADLLAAHAARVETALGSYLDTRIRAGEVARPERLMAAMRHGVLNGGKRLRPFLVMESAALFMGNRDAALAVAAGLECIHCYSLIHDDLPAMDDDDLRRGQPTVHRAFDEATAILAGDSLLTMGFDIVASAPSLGGAPRAELCVMLARAAGAGGMAGGQSLDLAAAHERPDEAGIIRLQAMKTGALIRFACEAGPVIGAASPGDRERMGAFGAAIGLAFQLADDLLDLTASADELGKATAKDSAAGKATLPALHGVDWTKNQLSGLIDQAHELLEPYGGDADSLREAARFIADRRN